MKSPFRCLLQPVSEPVLYHAQTALSGVKRKPRGDARTLARIDAEKRLRVWAIALSEKRKEAVQPLSCLLPAGLADLVIAGTL
ncbi:MAG: hypothetical protein AAGK79_04000 [Pseudomonadota bacterium]